MSAPKLLDRLRAKRTELLAPEVAPREYSQTPRVPPADGLQRRGAFIMPTRETMPAHRAHFETKAESVSTPNGDRQAERIRRLAALVTPAELLAARRKIKPALQKSLSEIDLHELALTLAHADKRENSTPPIY